MCFQYIGIELCCESGLSSSCFCALSRRSCREPGVCLFDSVGDSDAATAVVEECTAAIQRFKGAHLS